VTVVTDELLEACARLIPQLTRAPMPTRAELESLLASESVLVVAHAPGGRIVGAGALGVFRTPSGVHAHIEDIIVDEDARGQGCGEAIVRHLLDEARRLGLPGVSLTCNPRRQAANRLYRRMGFSEWDTNVYWYGLEG
jgi:ribosomal protein S18 acetylase RimI-like enzyme